MSEGEEVKHETCYICVKILWIFGFFFLKAIQSHSEVIKCALLKYNIRDADSQEKDLLVDTFQIPSERTK